MAVRSHSVSHSYTRRLASKMMMLPSITNTPCNPTRRARRGCLVAGCVYLPDPRVSVVVLRHWMTESSGSGPRQQYGHLMIATRELPGSRDGISHKLRSFASFKRFGFSAAVLHTAWRMEIHHLPQCASAATLGCRREGNCESEAPRLMPIGKLSREVRSCTVSPPLSQPVRTLRCLLRRIPLELNPATPHGCATPSVSRRVDTNPRNRSRLGPGCQDITISLHAAVSKGHECSSSFNTTKARPFCYRKCHKEVRHNDRDAPGSPSEMIGRAHYCMAMRYSPFRICRILKHHASILPSLLRSSHGCLVAFLITILSFSPGPCVTLHLCTWDPFETVIDFWLPRSHPDTLPLTIMMAV
jgi:hypothetical protein